MLTLVLFITVFVGGLIVCDKVVDFILGKKPHWEPQARSVTLSSFDPAALPCTPRYRIVRPPYDWTKEPPDAWCQTLPNGECVSKACDLHGSLV